MALSKVQSNTLIQNCSLARFLASQGMPPEEVTQAMGQLKDDMLSAYGQGIELHIVNESYLSQKENS